MKTNKIILLCLVFSATYVSCIIGGEDDHGQHRYVVSIRNERSEHICGGVIIAMDFVLTAATCVKGVKVTRPQDLIVVGGITNLNDDNGTDLRIDKIISKNPTGQNQVRNNIALLRIKNGIRPSSVLHPLRLPNPHDDLKKYVCEFRGWGKKSPNEDEATNTIQAAETKMSKLSSCKLYNKDIDESNICTYDVKAGLCKFDTGDPLVPTSGHYLWGIATDQHSCGSIIDDVYTRVDSHKDWINEVMNESSKDHKPQKAVIGITVLLMILRNQ